MLIPGRPPARHLRPRGDCVEQPITTVELFFDLVYVFAVTQLSNMLLGELTVAGVGRSLVLLAPLGSHISALALSATVAAMLSALALWELRAPVHSALGIRLGTPTDAPRALIRDLRPLQQQQEGTP